MALATYTEAVRPIQSVVSRKGRTHEGGVATVVDVWTALRRFLVLGTDGGTFYATPRDLTVQSVRRVRAALKEDGIRFVDEITRVSREGLAVKNEAALLALALASVEEDPAIRAYAFGMLPVVARTGTHLLHFAAYREALGGGWGRGMRRAVGSWFLRRSHDDLAYQVVKYKQRDGWSLADLLRLAHPTPSDTVYSDIFKYVVDGFDFDTVSFDAAVTWASLPKIIRAAELLPRVKGEGRVAAAVSMIRSTGLPREALPTEFLNSPEVWEALLVNMPMTALVRNLGKMTSVGLLSPRSDHAKNVVYQLLDGGRLRKARVHPISLLAALKVYEQGHGERGDLTWTPVREIVNALDEAFYLSFGNVPSTGQRIRLALDVSSSMDGNRVAGMPFLNARSASAAMALVTANVEPNAHFVAYSDELVPVDIRPSMRLDEVIRTLRRIPFGGTLCALPIEAALADQTAVDAFISYTDSETGNWGWNGDVPTSLRRYRAASGLVAKHAVVAATAGSVSVADPSDPLQLDVAGFSPDVPHALAAFLAL